MTTTDTFQAQVNRETMVGRMLDLTMADIYDAIHKLPIHQIDEPTSMVLAQFAERHPGADEPDKQLYLQSLALMSDATMAFFLAYTNR